MKRLSTITAAGLAAACLAAVPAAASAAGTDATAAAGGRSTSSVASSARGPLVSKLVRSHARSNRPADLKAAVRAYWTPARMRAAHPADQQPQVRAALARHAAPLRPIAHTARPGSVKPAAARTHRSVALGVRPNSDFPNPPVDSPVAMTNGKVFFTNATDGGSYVCSATVINTDGRDSVWTAGHCVHGGQGGTWHQNWVFVPAYDNGNAPYGIWDANQLWSRTPWMDNSDFTQDMGVAIMNEQNGQHIADSQGGQGIEWNQPSDQFIDQFGYPSESPFDGEHLVHNGSTAWADGDRMAISSDLTRGSSGGGWLAEFDGNWGYLDGVTSTIDQIVGPTQADSAYFGDAALDLFNNTKDL